MLVMAARWRRGCVQYWILTSSTQPKKKKRLDMVNFLARARQRRDVSMQALSGSTRPGGWGLSGHPIPPGGCGGVSGEMYTQVVEVDSEREANQRAASQTTKKVDIRSGGQTSSALWAWLQPSPDSSSCPVQPSAVDGGNFCP
ncbi:hypothetical protein GGTG_00575 [Gaeumannomyces tritici R3-111a-1]|uniref:Uncharacterized protein n=1 Tax=Gaeumannomyces tritici (strain R3-111a-1) TaxID=644352 RepID=J3NH37_GAET3|nr:hypothetical protein GGTG_00575 [Gaeumannomyces tritici R3-111a-1]EJT80580.1 hypothetical protein GGTG_00575 [Gaeumannomyces tritici R3-111a-1]